MIHEVLKKIAKGIMVETTVGTENYRIDSLVCDDERGQMFECALMWPYHNIKILEVRERVR